MDTVTNITYAQGLKSTLKNSRADALGRIRAVLTLRGETLRQFAHRLNRSPVHVYAVIKGERVSPPLRKAIAEDLGVAVEDIWQGEAA